MPIKETARSIRFSESLWKAIDQDAAKDLRSSVKQMEYVLEVHYGLRKESTVSPAVREAIQEGIRRAIPATEITVEDEEKLRGKRKPAKSERTVNRK